MGGAPRPLGIMNGSWRSFFGLLDGQLGEAPIILFWVRVQQGLCWGDQVTVFSAQHSLGSGMGASRQVFSGNGIPLSHSS